MNSQRRISSLILFTHPHNETIFMSTKVKMKNKTSPFIFSVCLQNIFLRILEWPNELQDKLSWQETCFNQAHFLKKLAHNAEWQINLYNDK